MRDLLGNLGQRIVEAARLAAAVHLNQQFMENGLLRRQAVIGGAEDFGFENGLLDSKSLSQLVREDKPSQAGDRPRRSSF